MSIVFRGVDVEVMWFWILRSFQTATCIEAPEDGLVAKARVLTFIWS